MAKKMVDTNTDGPEHLLGTKLKSLDACDNAGLSHSSGDKIL